MIVRNPTLGIDNDTEINAEETDEAQVIKAPNSCSETKIAIDRTEECFIPGNSQINGTDESDSASDATFQISGDASLIDFSDLNIKNYELGNIHENSSYVYVNTTNKGLITIRKSTLCWLLSDKTNRYCTVMEVTKSMGENV